MGAKTEIQWCDTTVNATTGCQGCELWNGRDIKTCYAGTLHESRLAKSLPALYDANFQNVRLAPGRMAKAAALRDLRGEPRPGKPWLDGMPRLIFVGDMGDFCSKAVPDDYIKSEIIETTQTKAGRRHIWLLLTKYPRRLAAITDQLGELPDNVMAMTTVTTQASALQRLPDLIDVKARWHGISAEPLWSAIDLFSIVASDGDGSDPNLYWIGRDARVDWVIGGGESAQGSTPRPMFDGWARSLAQQCAQAKVPYFHKQNGEHICGPQVSDFIQDDDVRLGGWRIRPEWREAIKGKKWGALSCEGTYFPQTTTWNGNQNEDEVVAYRVGKHVAGRLLDGSEHNGMPNFSEVNA